VKHFILLLILLVVGYFLWQYIPPRMKFFVGEFVRRHALIIIAIWVGLWAGLFFAAHNGSINIL
jgi:hypothetical protein